MFLFNLNRILQLTSLLFILLASQNAFSKEMRKGINYAPWADFAKNLKTCLPGSFQLPDPYHEANISYTIRGWGMGRCLVDVVVYYLPNAKETPFLNVNLPLKVMPPSFLCIFPPLNIPSVAQSAVNIANKKVNESQDDPSIILYEYCTQKTYAHRVNGR